MSESTLKITVLGDGGWGTAVSLVLAGRGHTVTMWGHDPAYLDTMRTSRENSTFLPGFSLPETLLFEADLSVALSGADLVVVAIPTKFLRVSLGNAKGLLVPGTPVVSLTKGVEQETLLRPSEVLRELLGTETIAVLSGPSHAEEVAKGLPATVVVAAPDEALAERVQEAFLAPSLRVYRSTDCVGVELGGALKNVMALAAGICTGLGLGDNALAALLTRGLAEMTRLGVALGAQERTFSGLSGLGDLVTTCVSPHGRNRAVGIQLGQGKTLDDILGSMSMVAEGVHTAANAQALGKRVGVELPIIEQVCAVLHEGKSAREAVTELMTRDARAE